MRIADLEDRPLQEIFAFLVFKNLREFGDVLGAVAGDDEEGVWSFDDDEAFDAYCGDEFAGAVKEIAGSVESVASTGKDVFAGLFGQEFINGVPGADIAPADFSGDDEDLWRIGLLRGAFEDGVVHGNVFELGIDGAEFFLVGASADGCG